MWKVVFRGIRETLERRVCRTNVYSQSSQENAKNEVKTSLTCQQKFLPPVFITCDKSFCGSAKNAGAKNKRGSDWNTKHSWTEAVGWVSKFLEIRICYNVIQHFLVILKRSLLLMCNIYFISLVYWRLDGLYAKHFVFATESLTEIALRP